MDSMETLTIVPPTMNLPAQGMQGQNLLLNSGFRIAQRYHSNYFSPQAYAGTAEEAYGPDRWCIITGTQMAQWSGPITNEREHFLHTDGLLPLPDGGKARPDGEARGFYYAKIGAGDLPRSQ